MTGFNVATWRYYTQLEVRCHSALSFKPQMEQLAHPLGNRQYVKSTCTLGNHFWQGTCLHAHFESIFRDKSLSISTLKSHLEIRHSLHACLEICFSLHTHLEITFGDKPQSHLETTFGDKLQSKYPFENHPWR